MVTETKTTSSMKKIMYLNKLDEDIGMICLHIFKDIFFHVSAATTPDAVWTTLEGFYGSGMSHEPIHMRMNSYP